MRRSARQATEAANKARLSGAIISDAPKNKKIAFADDDDNAAGVGDNDNLQVRHDGDSEESRPSDRAEDESGTNVHANKKSNTADTENSYDDDDAVEEVTGSAARASTQQSRDVERKISKEIASKKKRRKKSDIIVEDNASKVENDDVEIEDESGADDDDEEDEEEDLLLTDDFFKMVDSERASHSQQMKQDKKQKKKQQKRLLGKHTTFVVEGDYGTAAGPHPINQNIEVVALGGIGDEAESNNEATYANGGERQLLVSATLGMAPSKAATIFARGSMSSGISKARSSDSRKRQSKDEETWKRSRKLNRLGVGHRPGQAATLFLCKKK
ncbi:hypothetical protein ACHAXH_006257 [Discostella pseudostelligera]|jgi:hypothetical protein